MGKTIRIASISILLLVGTVANAEIVASVTVAEAYDSNIYRLDANEVDSWVTQIKPDVKLAIDSGSTTYFVEAGAESGVYSHSELGDDDYTDYNLRGVAAFGLNIRNKVELGLDYERGHDDRGMGRMDIATKLAGVPGDVSEPDEWDESGVSGRYVYGAPGARGSISISASHLGVDYVNHGPETDYLDRADTEMRLLGLLKLLPKTSFLLEARVKDINYDSAVPINRDSEDLRYFVGAQWEATGKTTSAIRLGYQEKSPDDPSYDDFDAVAWEADVIWAPKTYSTLHFEAYRGIDDSSTAITYVDTKLYGVRWRHDWNDRLNSQVYVRSETLDYEGFTREDDTYIWGTRIGYDAREWLEIAGEYKYEDRDSTLIGLDYKRSVVVFGATAVFE